jgi:hypothetical protein
VPDFIENIPAGDKSSRGGLITEYSWRGVKRGPIFVKQGSSGKWGLVFDDFVDE